MKRFTILSKLLTLTLIVAAVLALMPSPALAQATGNVEVHVVVPGVLQLRYYSELVVNVSATDFAQLVLGGPEGADDAGSATVDSWLDDAAIDTIALGGTTTTAQTVENAWMVRAVGNPNAGNNVRVDVALNAAASTLTNTAGAGFGTLALSSVSTQLNGGAGFAGSVEFASAGPGNPQYGDIRLGLDFANASHAGTYRNGSAHQFTITATSL